MKLNPSNWCSAQRCLSGPMTHIRSGAPNGTTARTWRRSTRDGSPIARWAASRARRVRSSFPTSSTDRWAGAQSFCDDHHAETQLPGARIHSQKTTNHRLLNDIPTEGQYVIIPEFWLASSCRGELEAAG